MADEITFRNTLVANKNGVTLEMDTEVTNDLAGSQICTGVQALTTSVEAIAFPADLTTEGITRIQLKNLDETATITLGLNNPITQVMSVIQPGETASFPPYDPNPTYYVKGSASCNMQWGAVGT